MTRRQFLAISALSALTCGGACAVGGLAGGLLYSRRLQQKQIETEAAINTLNAATASPAAPQQPVIIPREGWNARPVNHDAPKENGFYSADNPYGWLTYEGNLADIYSTIVIHHSYPIQRDTGTMLDIQNLHLDKDQWADIGYHYGIDGKGLIYAGRDIGVRGASVAGFNYGTIGVVLIGDFEQEIVSTEQLAAAQRLIAWLAYAYTITHLAGHYEFNPNSVCPGKNARPYLDTLAASAGLQRGTGGYVPPATSQPQSHLVQASCC